MSYFSRMKKQPIQYSSRLRPMNDHFGRSYNRLTHVDSLKIVASSDDDDQNDDTDIGVVTRTKPQTDKPKQYKVLLLNDDYTPMEFVVHVLRSFFQMDTDEATRVMLHVHQKGFGVCGIFTYEVAETKVTQVMDFARKNDHPLQCTLEKA